MSKLIKKDRVIGHVEELELAPRRKITRELYGFYYVCSECGREQSEDNRSCECCKAIFDGMTQNEEKQWKDLSIKLSQKFADFEIPYDALMRALWKGDLKKYID